jgi:hypothetical protein
VAYLYQQLQAGENLITAIHRYMHLAQTLYSNSYDGWFIYQLTFATSNRPFLLLNDLGCTNYHPPESILLKILSLALGYESRFSLSQWLRHALPVLQNLLPTVLPSLSSIAKIIHLQGDKFGVAMVGDLVTKFIRKIDRTAQHTYLRGQTLMQIGAQEEYEYNLHEGKVLRVFLPTINDFMYYPKPAEYSQPPEHNFKNKWLANM